MGRPAKKAKVETDPDDELPTRELVVKILGEEWLTTPNTKFGGQAPEELLGTESDRVLRIVAFNYKYGCFS